MTNCRCASFVYVAEGTCGSSIIAPEGSAFGLLFVEFVNVQRPNDVIYAPRGGKEALSEQRCVRVRGSR